VYVVQRDGTLHSRSACSSRDEIIAMLLTFAARSRSSPCRSRGRSATRSLGDSVEQAQLVIADVNAAGDRPAKEFAAEGFAVHAYR